ncbi:MAG: DUF1186 domain-containing protein [Candidatus Electrothrix sp. Rat3]|nr:DUF1186 domain-containing protein [Candidatus Electrothrix rattekaaiensis]
MESHQYNEPVSKLLSCGPVAWHSEPFDYRELGVSQEDVPELIRMSTDEELDQADSESDEVWAPVHAWRALGQLRAAEAVPPLLEHLCRINEGDDWAGTELPDVFAMIGDAAIPGLKGYLADKQKSLQVRMVVTEALAKVGIKKPETRDACVAVLEKELARFSENDPELNGSLIWSLLDLHAVEALPTMEVAYQKGCVDLAVCGDFEDVEIALGVREKRSAPKPQLWEFAPPAGQATKKKVGRNEPCPCGSGKKYKKCCRNT